MEYEIDESYLKKILEMLLTTPSPSGYCKKIMDKIEREASNLGYSLKRTKKGCGIITIPGENPNYTIGFSAHVDTLGAMVRSVKSSGTIRFTPIGSYMMPTVEGEYCKIHTRAGKEYDGTVLTTQPSVHVYSEARTQERKEENMEIRIDELVESKEDVEVLGVAPGDYISFDSRAIIMDNGFIKSRHLDDKAGVAALFAFMEALKSYKMIPKNNIMIFISNYEEVGHGASFIPEDIDEFIAIDMGAIGDDLSCKETQVSICAKDSSGPYDYDIVSKLVEIAKNNNIDYAIDVYPNYGSDVSAALKGGNNIKGALIGPGVHASHSMERTHMKALMNTVRLLMSYIKEEKR